jgi:hypothetical protein
LLTGDEFFFIFVAFALVRFFKFLQLLGCPVSIRITGGLFRPVICVDRVVIVATEETCGS